MLILLKIQNPTFTCFKQLFSEGVSSHETTFQEFKDETNLGKKRTVQVEDMYNVLLNISSELLTIKSMMKVNRKLATEQHQHETINEGNNCKYVLCNYTKYKRKYPNLSYKMRHDTTRALARVVSDAFCKTYSGRPKH